jgi:hypothetical protein
LLLLILLLWLGSWTTATLLLLLLLAVVAGLRGLALASLLLRPRSPVSVLIVLGRRECPFLWRSGEFGGTGHLLAVVGRALLGPRRGVLELLRCDEVVGRHGAVLVLVAGSGRRR